MPVSSQATGLACKQLLVQSVAGAWPPRREGMLALATGRSGVLQRVCSAVEEAPAAQGGRGFGAVLWHGIRVAFDEVRGAGWVGG